MRTFRQKYYPGVPVSDRSLARAKQIAKRRPARPVKILYGLGETKYFDCGINAAITGNGATWADTEVPCDNYVSSTGAAAAYTDSCLIPTAQGSAYGQVDGQRYKLKKLRVRGQVSVGTSTTQASMIGPALVRILLVMDTRPNGTQAQGEDVLQDYGAALENVYSFQRVASQSGRFRILKDKFFTLNPSAAFNDAAATGTVGVNGTTFKFTYQPTIPLVVDIANGQATPAVAGAISHNIFMLCMGVRGASAVAVTVAAASRCYFSE